MTVRNQQILPKIVRQVPVKKKILAPKQRRTGKAKRKGKKVEGLVRKTAAGRWPQMLNRSDATGKEKNVCKIFGSPSWGAGPGNFYLAALPPSPAPPSVRNSIADTDSQSNVDRRCAVLSV